MTDVYPKIAKRFKTSEEDIASLMDLFFDKVMSKLEEGEEVELTKRVTSLRLTRRSKKETHLVTIVGSMLTMDLDVGSRYIKEGLYRFKMSQAWLGKLVRQKAMDNKKYRHVNK